MDTISKMKDTNGLPTRNFLKRLKTIFYYGVLFIIFIFSPFVSSSQSSENAFIFFQGADTQFGMMTDNNGFAKEAENFRKVIEAANRLHPAFIIICGDLINQYGNYAQVEEFKSIASKLDPSIPLYKLPGNHDIGNGPTTESIFLYRRTFGPDYYSFQSHNIYGIVINSSLLMNPSRVPEEAAKQEEWIRTELKRAKELNYANIIVFQHIPWFIHQPNEKDQYFNIPLKRRTKYLELFHQYGVRTIFAGHLHKNAFGQDGNLKMITTSAIGKPLGKDPSGFRIVKVMGDIITYPYYSLDSIPKKIRAIP